MENTHRPIVIIANWKMNKTIVEARAYISGLALTAISDKIQVGVALPYTMLAEASNAAHGSSIMIGAQNVSDKSDGPLTGEISCAMLKDAGASFVIVGHSERRQNFGEDDTFVNHKAQKALSENLKVVLCVGETAEQHKKGSAKRVIAEQLNKCLSGITADQFKNLMISYEPVWAIGTSPATPEQTQDIHSFIRNMIANEWGRDVAANLIIQYGGSVNAENAKTLLAQPDVNGLLIGGASLSLDSFVKIIESVSN